MTTRSPVVALAALVLAGCAVTLADVQASKADGTARIYQVGADDAWRIARTVLHWAGAGPIEEHRDEGYMLTTFQSSFIAGSAGAWIEADGPTSMRVTVVTAPYFAGGAPPLRESTFHRRFEEALAIVKRGEPLPLRGP